MTPSFDLAHPSEFTLGWQHGSGLDSGTNLDEQRDSPRITLEIPVAFRNGLGQHCAAWLRNLSSDGLQVRCNIATAQIFHPLGGKVHPDNQPLFHATMMLPLNTGPEALSVGVRLIYSTTVNEVPQCVFGFRFLGLRSKARRSIETFLAAQTQVSDVDSLNTERVA